MVRAGLDERRANARRLCAALCGFVALVAFASPAWAGWFDPQWHYRRALDVNWDADHGEGTELATAEFYTAGHLAAGGTDVRITQEDGRVIPSHVLTTGPGDSVRIVFALTKGQTKYYAYFGNPKPPAPPVGTEDVKYQCGLLLDMRAWPGGALDRAEDLAQEWDRAKTLIGQIMIDRPFYGLDPFGDHPQWMSRVSGQLAVPVDGEYLFAGSADDRAALYLDGKPALFIPGATSDIRFNRKIALKRGRHAFVLYHVNVAGEGWFSIGWKRPDMPKVDIIGRESFGVLAHANAAPLEQHDKTICADFDTEYLGECFVGGNYSHRYRLKARLPRIGTPRVDWDLGDGTTASTPEVEHVYVSAGVYPVRLTLHVGSNTDTQTTKLSADRDFPNLDKAVEDDIPVQAKIIAGYTVANVPSRWLPWMALIEQHAGMIDPMLAATRRLAGEPVHANPSVSMTVLQHVTRDLEIAGKLDDAIGLWDRVPADSDLQPRAAREEGAALMWWVGDFDKAVKVLQPLAHSDDKGARRAYAEAMLLDGHADEGRKILDELQEQEQERHGARLAAISGAMARTIEYRINERDWETGEEEWERWESRCPSVFVEGYSVLLRTKLMEEKKANGAAAKVAEAFARAVPNSSYAPQLLDRASRLTLKSDPKKSADLRALLKTRYPEDPLSQDETDKGKG